MTQKAMQAVGHDTIVNAVRGVRNAYIRIFIHLPSVIGTARI